MSVGGSLPQQVVLQVLQQDLQNELTIANQLLRQISMELEKIKILTEPNGEFEKNVKQNAALIVTLASIQKIDLDKVPQIKRMQVMDTKQNNNHNLSCEQLDTFRDSMDENQ